MAAPSRKCRLSREQRRALEILTDAGQNGATEAIMLAHGFWREMLAELVLAGFAMAVSETIRTAGPTIKVERYHITRPLAGGRSKVDRSCAQSRRSPTLGRRYLDD